jgi:hypothetical protein
MTTRSRRATSADKKSSSRARTESAGTSTSVNLSVDEAARGMSLFDEEGLRLQIEEDIRLEVEEEVATEYARKREEENAALQDSLKKKYGIGGCTAACNMFCICLVFARPFRAAFIQSCSPRRTSCLYILFSTKD